MGTVSTTTEFELPVGFEDSEGTTHNTVVMRKVKNSDIIAIQKDQRLRDIAKENLDISNVRGNPVVAMRVNAQVAEMFSILFTRVVKRLGTIEDSKLTKNVFLEMYQDDMAVMMEQYAILNGVDLEQAKEAMLESPLA